MVKDRKEFLNHEIAELSEIGNRIIQLAEEGYKLKSTLSIEENGNFITHCVYNDWQEYTEFEGEDKECISVFARRILKEKYMTN